MKTERMAWTWRHAICKSDLPSTTRHVLHALSCWMNEVGGSCYPSTKDLAAATGYSERAVCTHLEKAESLGWLERRQHGFKGRAYRRNEYEATFPGSGRGSESEPDEVVSEGENADDALNEVQQVSDDALNEVQRVILPVHKPVQCSRARDGASPPDNTRLDDDGLKAVLLEAVGPAARDGAKGLGKLAVIRKWLDQGADLDRDIVPAIREKAATMQPGALRSWRFMDGPIGDWMRDRRALPDAKPVTACEPRDPTKLEPRQWRFWVNQWLNGSDWYPENGPQPGEPGCMVPDDVVAGVLRSKGSDAIELRKAKTA